MSVAVQLEGLQPHRLTSSMEDGELSDSDCDMTSPGPPAGYRGPAPSAGYRGPAPSAGYRGPAPSADSSDSGGDSDDDTPWRGKRQRVSDHPSLPPPPPPPPPQRGGPGPGGPGCPGRKVNNIWGSVVQQQSQDQVVAGLGVFGMEGDFDMGSRSVETYNYVLARKLMEKERQEGEQEEERRSRGERQQESAALDSQLDEYMRGRGGAPEASARPKRKRPAKQRLGPRAEMPAEGRYELREEDPEPRVVEELAYRLREPKLELLERVVRAVGRGAAIDLLAETAAVERAGGLATLDGSRRRTPGGVYLHLLKSWPGVSRAQLRNVFLEENLEHRRSKRAAQKRRRHLVARKMKQALTSLRLQEGDEASRETFASDTHDCLASLGEEQQEEEGAVEEEEEEEEEEEGADEEVAVGTEDTPVVYNSADLEVF